MYRINMIQEQIDITRRQIIEQLQDEIGQFQQKIVQTDSKSRGYNVYQAIISRKQALIQQLSELTN